MVFHFFLLLGSKMDKNLLKRATEDSDQPTPGYMFPEIAKWTFIDHHTQTKLIAALMEKLRPNASVHVLSKTLRIVKHLCENGHTDFQKEMQQRADHLKNFAGFRGTPDPKFGDTLNERVRQCAKDAIEAAFSHRREAKLNISAGHGSDSRYDEKKDTFTTGEKAGTNEVSNAHMAPMPQSNKWAEHMARGGGPIKEEGKFMKDLKQGIKTGFGLWEENVKSKDERMLEELNTTGEFKPIELPPSFGGDTTTTSHATTSWKFTDEQSQAVASAPKDEARIVTAFQKEVERIALFKATPQRVDLTTFVTNCSEIATNSECDWEDLAQAMDERLAQKYPWQQRLNVLSAIEATLRAAPNPAIATYFQQNPEDIQRNVFVVQNALKEKARKVLKMLNVPEKSGGSETSKAQQITTATSDGLTWAAKPHAVERDSADPAGGLDFGGMTLKTGSGGAKKEKDGDKTKLKKRAMMHVPEEPEPEPQQPSAGFDWGSQPAQPSSNADNGWGTWDTKESAKPASTETQNWFEPPAQKPPPQPQPAQQPAPSAPAAKLPVEDDFDAFFSEKPVVAAQPKVQPVMPPPPPPQPQQAAPALSLQPAQIQQIMQMQAQMQQLMALMASPQAQQDPQAMEQFQMMMQQQQQMMMMIQAQRQPSATSGPASPQQSPPEADSYTPHSHFQGGVSQKSRKEQQQQQQQSAALAAAQAEMMKKLLSGK